VQYSKRFLAFALPVVIGVALLVTLVMTRQGPHQVALKERTTPVRVIRVPRVDMVPRARAYGTVQPGRSWDAVAEVGGTVVRVNPKVKSGAFLKAGSVLLGVDPTDYELAIAQRRADIAGTKAQLLDNEVREANSRRSLAIEKQALILSDKELERRRRLARQGAASQSGVEQQERQVLVQRQNVISHENTLALLSPERKSLEAQLARYQAQLAEAEHNLQRATIRLPFDARISQLHVEKNQSVRPGDVLLVADDIATAEIEAQLPMQVVRNIMTTRAEPVAAMIENVGEVFGITARVRLPDFDIEWPGRLVRMSATLDPETRTVGAIVEVDEPYRGVIAGIRPPLVKEMFVEVDLSGRARRDTLVVPRTAVHDGSVYVVDAEGRLRIQPIESSLVQPEFLAVTKGVKEGDRLVISQLIPAIQGMLLEPQADEAARVRLISAAEGKE